MIWIFLIIVGILAAGVIIFLCQPSFGRTPRAERLERVKKSPNYHDGSFRNLNPTQQLTSDKGFVQSMSEFIFRDKKGLRPERPIPSVRTDLWELDSNEDLLVWFGHSSYLLQVDGRRLLVDPVLKGAGSPVWFINKPFPGTDLYTPDDIPAIDYLIITHDHWDHLDYGTLKSIKERVGTVVCGLGVGEHLERWGFSPSQIVEMDWNDSATLEQGWMIHCLPARHFSGRSLKSNQSLWVSYLLEMPSRKIFVGGDSGYDTHFARIGERFKDIDLAILENGQYNVDWRYIHTMPGEHIRAMRDLGAKRLFTVHNSKFALAKHPWDEPLRNIYEEARKESVWLIQPMIGQVVRLDDPDYQLIRWWENP